MTFREELLSLGIPVPAEVECLSRGDTVRTWARRAGMHHSWLRRRLVAKACPPPTYYVQLQRLLVGLRLLDEGCPICRASIIAGYTDAFGFTQHCVRIFGAAPSVIRNDWRRRLRERLRLQDVA